MANDIDNAWRRLAAGIVRQAVIDYRKAYTKYILCGFDKKRMPPKALRSLHECREFFVSDLMMLYCDANGMKVQKAIEKYCCKKLGFKNL